MDIDQNTVNDLAKLARLDLLPEQAPVFASQLPKIIEYVGQLQKVKTEIVPEVTAPSAGWREDETVASGQANDILTAAPDHDDRFWRVPSVF